MDNVLHRLGLHTTPTPGTLAGRLYAVAVDLDKASIYAVVGYRRGLTTGDAWCELVKETPAGMRPAMGDRDGDLLLWSFPYDDPTVARAIVKAFRANGFEASWEPKRQYGHYINRVQVHIDGQGRS